PIASMFSRLIGTPLFLVVCLSSVRTAGGRLVSAVAKILIANRWAIADQLSITKLAPVCKYHLAYTPKRLAVPRGIQHHRDHIPRLNRRLGPSRGTDRRRRVCFRNPMSEVPLVILFVKQKQRVRIPPIDLGHGHVFQSDRLAVVVRRTTMVAKCWTTHEQQS